MKIFIPQKIECLADNLSMPLYAVGGYVRNFLIDKSISVDLDIASTLTAEEFGKKAIETGFNIVAEYPRTNTVVISDGERKYEYTAFREEEYSEGGSHTPISTRPTSDLYTDALRRDFTCNAVYYDVKNRQIIDKVGGIEDIKNKTLRTVDKAEKVFSHDGLRLMRLARFAGELNFTVEENTLKGATKYAKNVTYVSAERILDELKKILVADSKYNFSNLVGHYQGLKILSETRVLDYILPELTLGRGMEQRRDFHNYDVLEHTLRSVMYAPKEIRLACLLHDVGKPYCMRNFNKYHGHDVVGENIAENILNRLKVSNKEKAEILFLVKNHMKDLKGDMREEKVRLFIAKNYSLIDKLILLRQADFRAGKDGDGTTPTNKKWQRIRDEMIKENTPLTIKQLAVTPQDLINIGIKQNQIGATLKKLWEIAVKKPNLNKKEILVKFI